MRRTSGQIVCRLLGASLLLFACSSGQSGKIGQQGGTSAGASTGTSAGDAAPAGTPDVNSSQGIPSSTSAPSSGGVSVGGIVIPDKGSITVEVGDAGDLVVLCGGVACACNDGLDNDSDGVIDGSDAECTGPFDADEGSFATGIPGDNKDPKWQDCFFDGNSGAGDDGCRYATGCIDGTLSADDSDCELAQECRDFCAPLAPPGCDCFGCCDVTVEGVPHQVLISDSCSTENINDEEACTPCTRSDFCGNECGPCELCLGKTLSDLPSECFMTLIPDGGVPPVPGDGGPGTGIPSDAGEPSGGDPDGAVPPVTPPPANVCDNGATACSVSADCGASSYCSLGCCRGVVLMF